MCGRCHRRALATAPREDQVKEPARFDSFRFRTLRQIIASVRFGSESDLSRFDAFRPAFF